jgi:predicted AlkP superfamily pyrophosphatase or phosphodiesterase
LPPREVAQRRPGIRLILVAAVVATIAADLRTRAVAQVRDPILVLVSFDGWRWDYTDRLDVPNVRALAARGVRVRELIPSFPALTFPNHYTIVTGLYPEHHGIVANVMIDPAIPERFTMSSRTSRDAVWWGGEPIWVTAIRQGRRAATMFWPGSEVAVGGVRPTYWKPFDSKVPSDARTAQALEWLALPEERRPSVVTLYQEAVDHAGHDFGPDSPELAAAAAELDRTLGTLLGGIERLGLTERTTVVLVSDHGMAPLSPERIIWLDDYIDVGSVTVTEWEGLLELTPRDNTPEGRQRVYQLLRNAHPRLRVFMREELPAHLRHGTNARTAAIIGLPDDGWVVTTRQRRQQRHDDGRSPPRGDHGYDTAYRDMHALFVAAGPSVVSGLNVPEMENVHIYGFLCAVARLKPAANDGDPQVTRAFLR